MLDILLLVASASLMAQGFIIRTLWRAEKRRRQEFRYLESVCLRTAVDAARARQEIEFLQEELRRLLEPTRPVTAEERERISGEVTGEQLLAALTGCAQRPPPER